MVGLPENMNPSPIVIGVMHLSDEVPLVREALTSLVKSGDRIGIEACPEDIELYVQSKGAKYPLEDLCERMKERDNLRGFPGNEINGINEFHAFFSKMYDFLLGVGAVPVGVGSRVRNTSYFDCIRKAFVDKEDFSREDSLISKLISMPHFDHYVARKIGEENLDGVIVGCDHKPISRIVGGEYIDLAGRDADWERVYQEVNDNLHETYLSYKDKMPEL